MHQTLGYLDRVTSSVKSGGMAALSLSLSLHSVYTYILCIYLYIYTIICISYTTLKRDTYISDIPSAHLCTTLESGITNTY